MLSNGTTPLCGYCSRPVLDSAAWRAGIAYHEECTQSPPSNRTNTMTDERTIDRDTYLKALGLFHLAQEHARKAEEYNVALNRLLGVEGDYSFLNDQTYESSGTLDAGLKAIDIEVTND